MFGTLGSELRAVVSMACYENMYPYNPYSSYPESGFESHSLIAAVGVNGPPRGNVHGKIIDGCMNGDW